MRKGEMYQVQLGGKGKEQKGLRPVIIIQSDFLNEYAYTTIIVPCTTNLKLEEMPSTVRIPQTDSGLNQDTAALCHQIRVIDKKRLKRLMTKLPPYLISKIDETLKVTLDLF